MIHTYNSIECFYLNLRISGSNHQHYYRLYVWFSTIILSGCFRVICVVFYNSLECVFFSFLAPCVRTFHISLGLLLLQSPCLFPIWDRYVSVRTEKILADEKIASLGYRADSWMEKFVSN